MRHEIERGWRQAQRAHANLALPLDDFIADIGTLIARSRARLSLPMDDAALCADAKRLHFEDLYLARLCERGDERGWTAFVERYEPDLRSVLRRHCDASEAESVTAEVLSEVALAPPSGQARTRLGTYDGTGPLWAWLATIGVRTARGRWRRRREVALEQVGDTPAEPEQSRPELDDQVVVFLEALRAGWAQLERNERLALGWKHRDGLAQRAIAKLLGVSEPTASRLVTRGVAKLQGSLAAVAQKTGPPDAALWTRLEKALSGFLESSDTPPPLEMES